MDLTYTWREITLPTIKKQSLKMIFNLYFLKGKTAIGKTTVGVLMLNEERIRHPRRRVGEKTREKLDDAEAWIEQYEQTLDVKLRNRIQSCLRGILTEAQPNSEYSATVATVIWHDDSYRFIKDYFQKSGWWSLDFQQLESAVEKNAFDIA